MSSGAGAGSSPTGQQYYPPPSAFALSSSNNKDPPAPAASADDLYSEGGGGSRYGDYEGDEEDDEEETADRFASPDAFSIRQEALKMLEVADDHLAGSPYSVHRTLSGGFMATHRMLSGHPDDGEPGDLRAGSRGSGTGRRFPAALSGLAYTAPPPAAGSSGRFPYRDDPQYAMEDNASTASYASSTRDHYAGGGYGRGDDEEEDAVVDVIAMERRNASYAPRSSSFAGAGSAADGTGGSKPWSSRYSIDRTLLNLSGGSTSSGHNQRFLDSMDRAHQRERQAARNMFGSAPEGAKSAGIFGSAGYNFRSKYVFGKQGVSVPSSSQNLYATEGGAGSSSSLPPAVPRKSWHEQLMAKRRQRKIGIGVAVALLVFIVAMSSVLARNKSSTSSALSPDAPSVEVSEGNGDGNDRGPSDAEANQEKHLLSFFATSDVPYTSSDRDKFKSDLAKLNPDDSSFLIHLGNIQKASESKCAPEVYPEVAGLFLNSSRITTFVIPGQEDWANCPDQDAAWDAWEGSFSHFSQRFRRKFPVYHQTTRTENIAFLSSGVYFVGIHVVAGSPYSSNNDPNERAFRNGENIVWIKKMVSLEAGNATAVVIFGNAKPNGEDNQSFFNSMAIFLKQVGLPTLYVHASDVATTGDGSQWLYQPFSSAGNVLALQVPQGGSNPPVRISVGAGSKTFVISNYV
jgi:hypothetical protein